jgi:hypothetical protein
VHVFAELVAAQLIDLRHHADKLEQALGMRLLERTTRRVTLTAVGRDFERKVRELLDELDATLLGIRGVAATRMGEVTVACVRAVDRLLLPVAGDPPLSQALPEGAREGAHAGARDHPLLVSLPLVDP